MEDADNTLPPSKKRAAGRQLSRDNPGIDYEDEASEQETGTFKKASDEVLANRRIVKVRHHQTSSAPSAPISNPFAGICLVPPPDSSATPAEVTSVAESERTVLHEVEEKNGVNKGTVKGKDENENKSENEVDDARAESTADKERDATVNEATKPELADVKEAEGNKTKNSEGKRTEKGKDENEKQSESEVDDARAESTADEDRDATVNEGAKPELADAKEAEGNKTENSEGKKTENDNKKDNANENVQTSAESASLSSFQRLSSSQNAFTGLAGTGFSSSTFSFGSISKDGSPLGSGSLFGMKNDQPSFTSFGFGHSSNGCSSLFGTPGASIINKSEGSRFPSMQEVFVETGEENEKAVFTADSALFEFLDGGWKERGKGELRVNVSTSGTGKARLVMRARGNYRLILNASLYPDMKLTNMEKRGVTFACVNSTGEGKDDLSTFALKFKDASMVEEFCAATTKHKDKTANAPKTPENSPKASDVD